MRFSKLGICLWLTLAAALGFSGRTAAAPFEPIYSAKIGRHPNPGLVQGGDGAFYGTTREGGPANKGTVFKMGVDGVVTTLVCFTGPNGSEPAGPLVQGADGAFYGMTQGGGSHDLGTVFKITGAGVLTTLAEFDQANGANPQGRLIRGQDGHFYGTTSGGPSGAATLFKVTAAGVLSTLATVPNLSEISFQGKDGDFYAFQSLRNNSVMGLLVKISPAGTVTNVGLIYGDDQAYVPGPLIQGSDGNFYGTTRGFNLSGPAGTVFKLTADGECATLVSFSSDYPAPSIPSGSLVEGSDGAFYGTTIMGGIYGYGTAFKVTSSGALTVVGAFAAGQGRFPGGGLIEAADGHLYGVTTGYENPTDPDTAGTIFRLAKAGGLTNLAQFSQPEGLNPTGPLAETSDHTILATMAADGPNGAGTLVEINRGGTLRNVASFGPGAGEAPRGGLIKASDGTFYGTTFRGGLNGVGSVFFFLPGGTPATTASFNGGNGSMPVAGLVQGQDGAFYGTTSEGGTHGKGALFKVAYGVVTLLASFDGANGRSPFGKLVQGGDGAFYGTTRAGGTNDLGTVFKLTSQGALTTLFSFGNTDGADPRGGLVPAGNGNFLGTTSAGGADNAGTIFEITPEGTLSTLVHFNKTNGAAPQAELVAAPGGRFYGTTSAGGAAGFGTVFELTANRDLVTLHPFDGVEGAFPRHAPFLGSDGNLYGTADQCVIWRIYLVPATTLPAGALTLTTASLAGFVNAVGADATVSFEYGTTTGYGSTIAASTPTAGPSDAVAVSAGLSGLLPHTLYHFRLKIETQAGTYFGQDDTFVTNRPPTAGTAAISVAAHQTVVANLPFATTDEDGDAVSVQYLEDNDDVLFKVANLRGNQVEITALPGALGKGTVYFTVSDGFGGTAEGTLEVTVTEGPSHAMLATSATAIPGAGEAGSGLPAGALWESFGEPDLTSGGDAVFAAGWQANGESRQGVVLLNGKTGKATVLAQMGDAPAGLGAGELLASFNDPLAVQAAQDESVVVFTAKVGRPGQANAVGQALCRVTLSAGVAQTVVLARTGAAAPALTKSGLRAAAFASLGLGLDGTLWARTTLLRGLAGVNEGNDQALLCWAPGSGAARLVLREGALLPLGDGQAHLVRSIATLAPAPGSPGHGRWTASRGLAMRVGFADGSSALVLARTGKEDLVEVARSNQSFVLNDAQGRSFVGQARWKSFGLPALSDRGTFTVFAKLAERLGTRPIAGLSGPASFGGQAAAIPLPDEEFQGIFCKEQYSSNWRGLALLTSGVEGFLSFQDPVTNSMGDVAFTAQAFTGGKVRRSLYLNPASSGAYGGTRSNRIVATLGSQAPGTAGSLFERFVSVALPDWGRSQPVFVATLKTGPDGTAGPGDTTLANHRGLWAVSSSGSVSLLLRTGFALPGSADGSPTVKAFQALGAVHGSPSHARAFDGFDAVLCRIGFSDDSTALVKLYVP